MLKIIRYTTRQSRHLHRRYSNTSVKIPAHNALIRQLYGRIQTSGPITIADYMRIILTDPQLGYYTSNRNPIGSTGDFITSPELGQMFGEMIAIWFMNEWIKIGTPKPFRLVELGPGRGTLSHDILRIFNHFQIKPITLDLIEISPTLSQQQSELLSPNQYNLINNQTYYAEGRTNDGVPIKWYQQLNDVPRGTFTLLYAHEFFDALPIHKFRKNSQGLWRELLIDITNQMELRYVLANHDTPMGRVFAKYLPTNGDDYEISPSSIDIIKQIIDRMIIDGGLALIADYGYENGGKDSFRAFKKHQLHDPLIEPGCADLTADVNFGIFKQVAAENDDILILGPKRQHDFLKAIGIEHRFKRLFIKANLEEKKSLEYGLKMMLDLDQMGERFKFMAIVPETIKPILDKYPLVGFEK